MPDAGVTMAVVPAWVEAHCVIPDGFRAGQPFRLYDYQLRFFAEFYRVRNDVSWQPASPLTASAFVYRRGLLVGPQKLGKGPHTAAHICIEGVGPSLFAGWAGGDDGYVCEDNGCGCGWEFPYRQGEPMGMLRPTPLIQVTAYSEEQTDNVYGALRPMIEKGPLADLIPKTGEEFIRLPGGGRIDTVTSSAQSRLGQRVTFVPQDEVGIWTRANKMMGVATTQYRGLAGMGGRASLTTNAWDPNEQSVAQLAYESKAQDIYRMFVQPPASLSYSNKRDRRKIHQMVYADTLTEAGGHVDLDAIEAEAADLLEHDPAEAERFFGNRLVAGQSKWMNADWWHAAARPDERLSEGDKIVIGFDGSLGTAQQRRKPDATCLGACRLSDGHLVTLGIWEPEQPDPDGLWSWEPDRDDIEATLEQAFDRYDVVLAWCDPQHWQNDIGRWAQRWGSERVVEAWTNRDTWMARELERLLTAIRNGDATHDGDAKATEHFLNARRFVKRGRSADPNGDNQRVLVSKQHRNSPEKIDMVPTWTLAYAARAHAIEHGLDAPKKPKSAPLRTYKIAAR